MHELYTSTIGCFVAVRYDLLQLAQSSGTFLSLLRVVVVVSCPVFASIVLPGVGFSSWHCRAIPGWQGGEWCRLQPLEMHRPGDHGEIGFHGCATRLKFIGLNLICQAADLTWLLSWNQSQPLSEIDSFFLRKWSMGKMLTHDSIAKGLWRNDYCSASPSMDAWRAVLANSQELLLLAIERMTHDYSSLNQKMRRPYGAKEVASWTNFWKTCLTRQTNASKAIGKHQIGLESQGDHSSMLRRLFSVCGAVQAHVPRAVCRGGAENHQTGVLCSNLLCVCACDN